MRATTRLASSLAIAGVLVLVLAAWRASSALPAVSDCCDCGSALAPHIDQARPVDAPAALGYWFVVEDCQAALAGRTREVMVEIGSGAALLAGGLGVSVGGKRRGRR